VSLRIAVDGYWASGKSAIAARLAARLGATPIRPFTDETAAELLGYVEGGELARFEARARAVLDEADRSAGDGDAVFDRHWFSVVVHLPEAWHARWSAGPRTYVCWADAETTARRLVARVPHAPDMARHARAVAAHRALAERLGLRVVDTSRRSAEECTRLILDDLAVRPLTR
jgi:hypothetical protein